MLRHGKLRRIEMDTEDLHLSDNAEDIRGLLHLKAEPAAAHPGLGTLITVPPFEAVDKGQAMTAHHLMTTSSSEAAVEAGVEVAEAVEVSVTQDQEVPCGVMITGPWVDRLVADPLADPPPVDLQDSVAMTGIKVGMSLHGTAEAAVVLEAVVVGAAGLKTTALVTKDPHSGIATWIEIAIEIAIASHVKGREIENQGQLRGSGVVAGVIKTIRSLLSLQAKKFHKADPLKQCKRHLVRCRKDQRQRNVRKPMILMKFRKLPQISVQSGCKNLKKSNGLKKANPECKKTYLMQSLKIRSLEIRSLKNRRFNI